MVYLQHKELLSDKTEIVGRQMWNIVKLNNLGIVMAKEGDNHINNLFQL